MLVGPKAPQRVGPARTRIPAAERKKAKRRNHTRESSEFVHVCWIRARPLSGPLLLLLLLLFLQRRVPSSLSSRFSSTNLPLSVSWGQKRVYTRLTFLPVHRRAFIGLAFFARFLRLRRSLPRKTARWRPGVIVEIAPRSLLRSKVLSGIRSPNGVPPSKEAKNLQR